MTPVPSRPLSRRSVAAGFWAAPAVLTVAAAPAASASTPSQPPAPPVHDPRPAGIPHREFLQGRRRPGRGAIDFFGRYMSKYANDVVSTDYANNWFVARANHLWRNLTPGKTYTFAITTRVQPYDTCPAMSSSQTVLVYSSSDGQTWTENANILSRRQGLTPSVATTAPTVLTYGIADDVCNNGHWEGWGPEQTVTFTQTAGQDGTIRFRYDAWYQSKDRATYPSRRAGYDVPTGNDRIELTIPQLIE